MSEMYESQEEMAAKIQQLPAFLKREVYDYVEFLLTKYQSKGARKMFSFQWEGGLEEMKDAYTSVALQHHASELR